MPQFRSLAHPSHSISTNLGNQENTANFLESAPFSVPAGKFLDLQLKETPTRSGILWASAVPRKHKNGKIFRNLLCQQYLCPR